MSQIVVGFFQAQKFALEQIVLNEAKLIKDQQDREWKYKKKEDSDTWFADQTADLEAWHDYLYRKHHEENLSRLPGEKSPPVEPKSRPFPRYFAMLGDQAAGESMCDEIGMLMIEIALIVSMQMAIGTSLGVYERERRSALKKLQPIITTTDSSGSDVILTRRASPRP